MGLASHEYEAISKLLNSYKLEAKSKNLSFSLCIEEFASLIKQNCTYCGLIPKIISEDVFTYNTVDRVDNSVGYELHNVASCCKTCNHLKTSHPSQLFFEYLEKIKLNHKVRSIITENKLQHYHDRAIAVANMSHDSQTKVGALLINKDTGAVMAEGYNGFIRGADDALLPNTRPEKYDYIVHAETNVLCNAVRHGVSTNNNIIYCTLSPCKKCLRMLWQAGIKEFYFKEKYSDFIESTSMKDIKVEVVEVGLFFKMSISPA